MSRRAISSWQSVCRNSRCPSSPPWAWARQAFRPYLRAYERDEKARLQQLRRDTLWYATYGIDLDTRDIRGWLEAA
ncbi:hypothetical protein ACFYPC_01505 [Streptomyces sp. NPDC005808]|uniref:hypothetical protein n=1 Tax=Streptomyces sp. NPDC005808 TaxID=3364734 RepID=UPI0036BC1B6D